MNGNSYGNITYTHGLSMGYTIGNTEIIDSAHPGKNRGMELDINLGSLLSFYLPIDHPIDHKIQGFLTWHVLFSK